jgi:hypothetical protein
MAESGRSGPHRVQRLAGTALVALTLVGLGAGLGRLEVSPDAQLPSSVASEPHVQLRMFRQDLDGAIEELSDGASARQGDLVQPAYEAAGNVHGVLVSMDAEGTVTLHHPDESHESTRLSTSGLVPLDHSFELDDSPHFERFVLITSQKRDIDVGRVLQAATALAQKGLIARDQPLALPPDCDQTSFVLRKPPR